LDVYVEGLHVLTAVDEDGWKSKEESQALHISPIKGRIITNLRLRPMGDTVGVCQW